PLKINEYLSAGKPVISTNFSEDLADFRDLIFIGETHDSFVNLINIALKEDSEELRKKRMAHAENNNWEKRVAAFWQILNNQSK
ncbi:MAG: group 1 glycosyl transferase, partial [Cytophagales bacterium]|nr:group 1 glycosyl transferase [Cytophagales bacterium]